MHCGWWQYFLCVRMYKQERRTGLSACVPFTCQAIMPGNDCGSTYALGVGSLSAHRWALSTHLLGVMWR